MTEYRPEDYDEETVVRLYPKSITFIEQVEKILFE
jgi:hypothetical protein